MPAFFRPLVTALFFAQSAIAAPLHTPAEARDPTRDQMAANQTEALKKGPECNERLLNELNAHIYLHACLTNFDSNCWEMVNRYGKGAAAFAQNGGLMGLGVSANMVGQAMESSNAGQIERLKRTLESGKYSSEIEKYKGLYESTVKAEDLDLYSRKGKHLTPDQAREATLKTLERLSSAEDKAFSKSVGAVRRAVSKKILAETVKKYGLYIAAGGGVIGGIVAAIDYTVSSDSTVGRCQDHGVAFIDYSPSKIDPAKCDFSFSLTGSRVHNFMSQPRAQQVEILKNNAATCEYYYYLNEHLKGEIVPQVLAMQNVEFTQVPRCNKVPCPPEKPTCDAQEVNGVEYEVKVDGQTFKIASSNDTQTKTIRSISLTRLQDGRDYDGTVVSYTDLPGGGSRPTKVQKKYVKPGSWETEHVDFSDYAADKNDPRVQNTVNLLTKSQIWSPLVASCCAETDTKKCIKEKLQLPGLAKPAAPSELQPTPAPKAPANAVDPKLGTQ